VLAPTLAPGGRYIGLDVDETMLQAAEARLSAIEDPKITLIKSSFAEFSSALDSAGVQHVDHMLLDLGVNSAQLDDERRGFSFDRDGPLDMRLDPAQRLTATDLVNGLKERELSDLFWEFAQEPASRKIAREICVRRRERRMTTTRMLAQAVEAVCESRQRVRGRTHPATGVFQALRIAVNRELDNLTTFLSQAFSYLRPGGKLAIISFHSLEDKAVKVHMRAAANAGQVRILTRKPIVPETSERRENPRCRSAKLRVAERTGD
jgi:16S rRNA (cytosine1402-N4)-methyltransferase